MKPTSEERQDFDEDRTERFGMTYGDPACYRLDVDGFWWFVTTSGQVFAVSEDDAFENLASDEGGWWDGLGFWEKSPVPMHIQEEVHGAFERYQLSH